MNGVASTPPTRGAWVTLTLVLIAVLGAYAPCTQAPFFWDDKALIVHNPLVTEHRVGELLFGQLWNGAERVSPYHRPAVMLDFALDHRMFGLETSFWHLHSLLWHVLATGLLHRLLVRRVGTWPATAATLVFALHPIQSEAVLWIAARNDLMCAAGILGALLAVDAAPPTPARAVAAFGATLLACFSKELGYVTPVLLVAWTWGWDRRLPTARAALPVLVGVVTAGLLRAQVNLAAMPQQALPGDPRIEVPADAVVTALGWLSWPWPLTSTASVWMTPGPTLYASAILTVVGLVALAWRSGRTGTSLLCASALLWAPTLSTTWTNGLLGERYLYVPLAFAAMAISTVVPPPERRPGSMAAWGVVGLGVLASLVTLGVRLADWHTPVDLLRAAARRSPDSYVLARLGSEAWRAGEREEGLRAFRAAADLSPLMPVACTQPLDYLLAARMPDIAARMADDLEANTRCPTARTFQIRALQTRYAAGRGREAWTQLRAWQGLPPDELLALNLAICEDRGDLLCAAQLVAESPSVGVDLRVHVHDLRAWDAP